MAKSLDIIDPKRDEPTPEENNKEPEGDDIKMEESGGGGVFYLVLGIIAVVVATAAALYILYKDKPANSAQSEPSAAATASQSASQTSSATTSAAASATASATSSSGTSMFKYTDETIRIANGNGISGEGAKIKQTLEDAGFKVASVGNASKNYDQTVVFYKTGQKDLAEALKSAISSKYTAELTESDTTVGTYDAVIALGTK